MLDYQRENLDGLDDGVKNLYQEKEGKFFLQVTGIDDAAELKEALRKEREEKKQVKERLKSIEEKAREAQEAAARQGGDVEALENSWKEKLSKREQELLGERDALTGQIKSLTVGRTATDIASDLAVPGSAKALLPHIERRLSMEIRDGQPTVIVLDANGKPSASTLDELKAEFAKDAAFAPLIRASDATGGGASGSKSGGGAATKGNVGGTKEERRAYAEQLLRQNSD